MQRPSFQICRAGTAKLSGCNGAICGVVSALLPGMSALWQTSEFSSYLSVMKPILLILFLGVVTLEPAFSETLFTVRGTDPSFEELVSGGKLEQGKNSKTGVSGSTVEVRNNLVELTPEAKRPIANHIKIHTLGNSAIPRADFKKWSRWYQEHGSTQVFRLFRGETNVRNTRENAARIEAFSGVNWKLGAWHEWSGTFTVIQPIGTSIFQVKNNINDWAIMLNINENGDLLMNHRRAKDKVIATGIVGKPFHIRVRDNGLNYEVYLNGVKQGEGEYPRPTGTTAFRWGMYLGNHPVKSDAMIFVSGATVD